MAKADYASRARSVAWWRLLAVGATGLLVLSGSALVARAATLAQTYRTKEAIALGSLVSLDRSSQGMVTSADSERASDLLGVVITADQSLLSLSSGADQSQVAVATGGQAMAIVSNLNGAIKRGDAVTASPVRGVGMKATTSTKVVGVAQADYDGSQPGSKEVTVTTKSGQAQKVKIGRVELLVEVAYYTAPDDQQKTIIPPYLQQLANTVAGKEVSVLRIILSFALLGLVFSCVAIFIYGAVKSSIISIGRNPLSQKAVRYSLAQVILAAIIILLLTLGAIYLILSG